MIFSVNYQSKHKQEAEEIRCPVNQLGLLIPFIHENPAKRVNITCQNIEVLTDIELRQINFIRDITENYTIESGNIAQLSLLLSERYHTYLKYPATDWETFSLLTELGVSDIYVDGPLCFQMNKLSQTAVKKRISPIISPNASLAAGKPNNFFVRPEDLRFYSPIVDIIDFKEPNQDKEDALFTIYKRGTFNYSLKDLIPNFPYDINNIYFTDEFVSHRLNCGQRCKEPKSTCHLCGNYFNVIQNSLKLIKKTN